MPRIHVGWLLCLFLSFAATAARGEGGDKVSYHRQVKPIFQANCQGCHQPAKAQGEYVMTDFARLLKGGESLSAAVVAGKPGESYLIDLITPNDGEAEMPKGKPPLSGADRELIQRWIAQGADDDTPAGSRRVVDAEHPPVYTTPPVIGSLAFSPDGKWLALTGYHEVLLYKSDGSELVARLIGMSERIESVAFSPDGKWLAASGGNPSRTGEIQVWDVEKRELTLAHAVTYDTVYGASWSPDGKLIAFGCGDNTVRAINAKTGEQVLYQGAHNDWPLETVFSHKGTHLISVGRDRTAKLTEVGTQRFIDNITSITPGALKGGVNAVARRPDGDEIVVGGADGRPKLFRIFRTSKRVIGDNANLIREYPPLVGRIFDVDISRDGKMIAAASSLNGSGELKVYTYASATDLPKELQKIVEKRAAQRSAEEKKKLAAYRKQGVKVLAEATLPTGLYAIAFNNDGSLIAAAGADGVVRFVDTSDGSTKHQLVVKPESETKSQQDKQVAARRWRTNAEASREKFRDGDEVVSLRVEPPQAELLSRYEVVQFVVQATLKSGAVIDVTRIAEITSSDAVEVSSRGLARALHDGQAEVTFALGGKSAAAAINVKGFDEALRADFRTDVAPVVAKMGCNAGTCHGANKGKGGFKLSLRGNDPLFDVRALTDDLASRRVNLASPENSLMLLKAISSAPHEGGQRCQPGDPYYETVHSWIAAGARLKDDQPPVTGIQVYPKNPTIQRVGDNQQFRVVATFSDGRTRDVTQESYLASNNTDVVTLDAAGLGSTLRRGEAPLLARYEGKYAATTVTVMGDREGFAWAAPPTNNFVDELVAAKLKRLKVLPSELCNDAEFVRRVHLDLVGLPPKAEEVEAFLKDKRPTKEKRDELIDRLIGSPDFVEHWTNKWADLLQVNRKFLGVEGAQMFRDWIKKEVQENTPYDQFVMKILTSNGSNRENPAASYFKITRTPQDTMENTTQLFLGLRFNCNKCHDHPFERWTQDQYYETAAYFAQLELKKDPASGKRQIGRTAVEAGKPLFEIVADKKEGDVVHDRTGQVTPPKFPYEASLDVEDEAPRRSKLAEWLTSADNQYFAMSYVNRLWGYLLGQGIIEPLDDIRAGNPPSNPELLQRLTEEFVDHKFDVQHMLRLICKSRTYQLSVATHRWNKDDTTNYSHAMARRLPAEVLFDAIHRVTGSVTKLPGVPAGTRAASLPDAGVKLPDGFLTTFGRPARESACECERSTGMQLGPIMALVSGPTLDKALTDPKNSLATLSASDQTNEALVNALFLRVLSRQATKKEIAAGVALIDELPAGHTAIKAKLAQLEKELAPAIAARESQRQSAIDAAKTELAAYEKEIAPRELKLTKQRQAKIDAAQADLTLHDSTLEERLAEWTAKQSTTPAWVPVDPKELSATGGTELKKEADLSILATKANVMSEYKIVIHTELEGVTAVRLEVLADKRLPKKGPGRAPDGNFVLTEFEMTAAPLAEPQKSQPVKFSSAQADFSQKTYAVATAIDGKLPNQSNGWAIAPKMGVDHRASFQLAEPLTHEGGSVLTIVMKQKFSTGKHNIGRFRLSLTTTDGPILLDGPPQKIVDVLKVEGDKRNDAQKAELKKYYQSVDGKRKQLQAALANAKKPRPVDPQLKKLRDALTQAERPVPTPTELAELRRDVSMSEKQLANARLTAAQDITWALINSPSFLFNR